MQKVDIYMQPLVESKMDLMLELLIEQILTKLCLNYRA